MMISLLAYFDPSTGSLLLQALVGGFGGVIVLGRYTWRQLIGYWRAHATMVQAIQPPSSIQM